MIRILAADDDAHILKLITVYLKNEGFVVLPARDGAEALQLLEKEKADLAIIDLMMPKMDGYELCREIRTYYDMPILMLTAKGEPEDKIKGFQLGTDDYVVKPFDPIELVLRVRALLRRAAIQSSHKLEAADITMDALSKEVWMDGRKMMLPLKEFEILFKMASYPNRIFTRGEMIEQFWGADYEGDDRTVDVHVKRVRDRLREAGSSVKIATVRGLGYRLEAWE
ncbi:response regulator transcription factor [Metabacillus sp. 84]|uniref:response regulator transcription factor n=1 Tax=unclassified Metabacillus TaxID=2675274 RepID=UPI003CF376CC